MNKIKKNGVHYTPENIVDFMIEKATKDKKISEMLIMENSCGSGNFLIEIVDIIISELETKNTSEEISTILENNIYGVELDIDSYNVCMNRLKEKTFERIGIYCNFPNIINANTLYVYQNYISKFDLIIGNPPYVRIHNMDTETKNEFSFSKKGMTDLYLIFYEISILNLKNDGILCYITPDSWSKSTSGSTFRNEVYSKNLLSEAVILGHYNPFVSATTYTGVFIFDKNKKNKNIKISKLDENGEFENSVLSIDDIYINDKFYFNSNIVNYLNIINNKKEHKIKLKNGVATLKDSFFIHEKVNFKLKRPIYKISQGKYFETIFPYSENNIPLTIEEIKTIDLNLYQHLEKNKEDLNRRSIEKKEMWYAYGRSQGLSDIKYERIAINNLFKSRNDLKIAILKPGVVCYSGLYMTIGSEYYEKIKEILFRDDFENYFKCVGDYKSGGYYALKAKDLQAYINYYLI